MEPAAERLVLVKCRGGGGGWTRGAYIFYVVFKRSKRRTALREGGSCGCIGGYKRVKVIAQNLKFKLVV